jgi:hypothetical protein
MNEKKKINTYKSLISCAGDQAFVGVNFIYIYIYTHTHTYGSDRTVISVYIRMYTYIRVYIRIYTDITVLSDR